MASYKGVNDLTNLSDHWKHTSLRKELCHEEEQMQGALDVFGQNAGGQGCTRPM